MLLKKHLLVDNIDYKRYKQKPPSEKEDYWKETVCGGCKYNLDKFGFCKLFNSDHQGYCGLSIVNKIFKKSEITQLKLKIKNGGPPKYFYSPKDSRKSDR